MTRLNGSNPDAARSALRRGEAVTVATSTGVRAGVAVGVTVTGGSSTCVPPCDSTCDTDCSTWSNCGTCSWWWGGCSSYWWPFWGAAWGFGYWYDNYGYWSGGSPYYAYPYVSYAYAPPPIYYSTVIYDAAAPEVVVSGQPAGQSNLSAAVVVGEGQVSVAQPNASAAPAKAAPSSATSRAVSEYLALGDQAFRAGRYNDAVVAYARAVEASPDDGVLHLVFSDALFAAGEYHFAASALRRALELEPKLLGSVVDKHGFYGDPSELERHLALLEAYLEKHYTDDDARLLLAANYLFAGRATRAVELLETASSASVRESSSGSLILARAQEQSRPEPTTK